MSEVKAQADVSSPPEPVLRTRVLLPASQHGAWHDGAGRFLLFGLNGGGCTLSELRPSRTFSASQVIDVPPPAPWPSLGTYLNIVTWGLWQEVPLLRC